MDETHGFQSLGEFLRAVRDADRGTPDPRLVPAPDTRPPLTPDEVARLGQLAAQLDAEERPNG